jgi:hypothetical protein
VAVAEEHRPSRVPCPLTAPTIGELRTIDPFWNDQ